MKLLHIAIFYTCIGSIGALQGAEQAALKKVSKSFNVTSLVEGLQQFDAIDASCSQGYDVNLTINVDGTQQKTYAVESLASHQNGYRRISLKDPLAQNKQWFLQGSLDLDGLISGPCTMNPGRSGERPGVVKSIGQQRPASTQNTFSYPTDCIHALNEPNTFAQFSVINCLDFFHVVVKDETIPCSQNPSKVENRTINLVGHKRKLFGLIPANNWFFTYRPDLHTVLKQKRTIHAQNYMVESRENEVTTSPVKEQKTSFTLKKPAYFALGLGALAGLATLWKYAKKQ